MSPLTLAVLTLLAAVLIGAVAALVGLQVRRPTRTAQATAPERVGPSTEPIPTQGAGRHRQAERLGDAVTATGMLRAARANPRATVDERLQAGR